uniref:Uncharacterized protein n=1 Tax=Esox lucius TaxID=8010 RepID=A0AAY5KUV0_ESOLU
LHTLDGVLDVSEHQANVLRVNGRGEVVVQGFLRRLPPLPPEAFHQEALHVGQAVGLPGVLWEIVIDGDGAHLLLQQVRLVEEEDDGDVGEDAVVHDGLKDVEGLAEPIGLAILHQDLERVDQEGDKEEDGGNILDLKVVLVDPLGGLTGQKDVLLSWKVVLEGGVNRASPPTPHTRLFHQAQTRRLSFLTWLVYSLGVWEVTQGRWGGALIISGVDLTPIEC